jgi:SAM-dependent methyltransferase
MLCVPIERADGSALTDFGSASPWSQMRLGPREARPKGRAAVVAGELLDEVHHRIYATPWITGRFRFDVLIAHGLLPHHRVLDLGCGAGRLGVWLVQHLEPGHYCGIDAHLRSLVAFSAYEIRLHGLAAKKPRLLLDQDLAFEHFGERFDIALDVSVSRFLPLDRFRQAFARLRSVLAPGGRLFAVRFARDRLEILRNLGFELMLATEVEWPLPAPGRDRSSREEWHVFRLPSPPASDEEGKAVPSSPPYQTTAHPGSPSH